MHAIATVHRQATVAERICDAGTALARAPVCSRSKQSLLNLLTHALSLSDDRAIASSVRASSPQAAQLIMDLAQRAAEQVHIVKHGLQLSVTLQALPILFRFPFSVPETQLDTALHQLEQDSRFWDFSRMSVARKGFDYTLVKHFYTFEELDLVPLSAVRNVGLSIAALTDATFCSRDLIANRHGNGKRSPVFLRYVIGQVAHVGSPPTVERRHFSPSADAKALVREVLSKNSLPCDVLTQQPVRFFDALYEGLFAYQSLRLEEIVATALDQSSSTVTAKLSFVTVNAKIQPEIVLCDALGNNLGQKRYLLRSRFTEPLQTTQFRIEAALQGAGVNHIEKCVDTNRRSIARSCRVVTQFPSTQRTLAVVL